MQERSFIFNFKFILKALLLVIVVLLGINGAGAIYSEAASKNTVNAFTKQRFDEFYALPKNSLDMVFLGSSHSYCTFDPTIIDKILGTESWQLGTPSQHPDTTYYLLKEVLNYQSPKTVVMEVYWDVCDDEFEPKQADGFFEVLRDDELKKQYIKEVFPMGEKVKYKVPVIRFQQDYFAYEGKEMETYLEEKYSVKKPLLAPTTGTEYYSAKGYVYCDIIIDESEYDKTNQFKSLDGAAWEFNEKQQKYLEKIIDLCKQQQINLVFVTAPVANVSMSLIKHYEKINEKVSDFAAENGIPYIDYNMVNTEEKLLQNSNFRDDAHMNHSGIEIVDRHFANWISAQVN